MKLFLTYLLIISQENVIIESSSSSLTLESLTQHVLQLEQTLSDLQSQSKTQEQKYAAVLQSVLSKLTTTTDELYALKEEHNSTLSEMKAISAANNMCLQSLQTQMKTQEHSHESLLLSKIANTTTEMNVLKSEHKSTVSELKALAAKINSPAVSYAVTQLSNNLENVTDDGTFKFDTVDLNIGGGYDNTTGIFTAPVSGIYLFWCQVMVSGRTRLSIEFRKNGIRKVYGYTRDGDKFGMAYLTTVLQLKQYDTIPFSKRLSSGIRGNRYSSYGGALLRWIP